MRKIMTAAVMAASVMAASVMAATGAQAAEDSDFVACDGYRAPRGSSDGLSRANFLLGLASRSSDNRRVDTLPLGPSGQAACERVLTDRRLKDGFWIRRAHILQMRAMHALASNDIALALAALDESDGLGTRARGPSFARSLGAGNQAIRVYALIQVGRRDEAREALDRLRTVRNWSASTGEMVFFLEMQLDSNHENFVHQLQARARLQPSANAGLFNAYFLTGQFAEAIEIYPLIDYSGPQGNNNWVIVGDRSAQREALLARTDVMGAAAYALAASGQRDEAEKLLRKPQALAHAGLTRPSSSSDGRPPSSDAMRAYEHDLPYFRAAKDKLDRWQAGIALRQELTNASIPDFEQALLTARNTVSPMSVPDLVRTAARAASPHDATQWEQVLSDMNARMEQERVRSLAISPAQLLAMLPKVETDKAVPVLKPAGDGFYLSDSGLSRLQETNPDIWFFRYTHKVAPIEAAEELVMLAAAQTAERQGRDGMVVLDVDKVSRQAEWGGDRGAAGNEAQLRAQFVNLADLPPDIAATNWRVIPVRQMLEELSSRYETSNGITLAW